MRAFRRGFSSRSSLLASPQILQCSRLLGVSSAASAGTKGAFDDTEVRLRGFVRSIRKQKRIAFAQISDGSTVKNVQAVFEPGKQYAFSSLIAFSRSSNPHLGEGMTRTLDNRSNWKVNNVILQCARQDYNRQCH